MRKFVLATWLFGAVASVLPWATHAMGLLPHAQHSDLWIALGVFLLGLLLEAELGHGPRRVARAILGLAAVGVAAANLPDLWERSADAGQPGLKGYFGEAAAQRVLAYAAVALAGLALVVISALERTR